MKEIIHIRCSDNEQLLSQQKELRKETELTLTPGIMRNNFFLIAIISIMIICTSCSTGKQPKIDVETEIINFFDYKIIEFDDMPDSLIKGKQYIKLDASAEDFFFKIIDKVKICDDRIFILDTWVKKLMVFDTNGKGIGKVGARGQGPGEYLNIADFDVDNFGNIYFIDGTGGGYDRLFVFDKNLKFVSMKKMPFEADIISCLSNNKLLFGLASWNKEENVSMKIALTDMELKTEQSYLPYGEYFDDAYWISGYTFVNSENKILYNKQIDDFVYEFSDKGLPVKSWLFDFGNRKVPDKYKKDIKSNLDKFEQYCCLKNFVAISEKYILGTLLDKTKTRNFIIDKNAKSLYLSREFPENDESYLTGYCDNRIISYIYPNKYEDIQATDLPEDVKKHIEDENFVLCISALK
ncbi:MAG: 6-bladed beta-propeller [Prevotellaceae bacterium]|nr:6-bladed beta-propeller [Prevotellaceae bacterium]